MADIQQRLNVDVNYASQYRLRLIAAELIYTTRRGYVDFESSHNVDRTVSQPTALTESV